MLLTLKRNIDQSESKSINKYNVALMLQLSRTSKHVCNRLETRYQQVKDIFINYTPLDDFILREEQTKPNTIKMSPTLLPFGIT